MSRSCWLYMRRLTLSIHAKGDMIISMAKKKPTAVEWGRKGGLARAARQTAKERSASARRAALAKHQRSTPAERSVAMQQAVLARWKKDRAAKKKAAQ